MTAYSPVWVISFLLAAASVAGCATVPSANSPELVALPESSPKTPTTLENNLGAAGEMSVAQAFMVEMDPPTQHRLSRIGSRLALYGERPNVPYHYGILDTKKTSALSLPHGGIYLTRGMVELLAQDDEVAAVIAHELAHVTHQHAVQAYKRHFSTGRLLSQAFLGPWIVRLVSERGYSHRDEYQADVTALRYMIRAGYPPQTYLETMAKIASHEAEEAGPAKGGSRGFSSTHPGWDNRIELLQQTLPKLEQEEAIRYDPKDFTQ